MTAFGRAKTFEDAVTAASTNFPEHHPVAVLRLADGTFMYAVGTAVTIGDLARGLATTSADRSGEANALLTAIGMSEAA